MNLSLTRITGEALSLDASTVQEVIVSPAPIRYKGRPCTKIVHDEGTDVVRDGYWTVWKAMARAIALRNP